MRPKCALFIGTGGGNDIFSTTLAMACLRDLGWHWDVCDIAGVVSPFHDHTLRTVVPGFSQTLPTSRRFLLRRTEGSEIEFIDARVARMVAAQQSEAGSVFALSLNQGTKGLTRTLQTLAHTYSLFVLVDVGGDILYRGPQDTHVLSPMFDAMVLRAFVDAGVPGILFEAGPGTDGELEPESLHTSLSEYEAKRYPIPSPIIDTWEQYYEAWIAPHRPGRTVPVTIRAYREQAPEIRMTYRARGHLGATRIYSDFEQRIDTELCKHFYLLDPAKINNPFAVPCSTPLEWFIATQVQQHHTNNEANLEYFRHEGKLMQLLTPSPLLESANRRQLIEQGLDEVGIGMGLADTVIFMEKDTPLVDDHFRVRHRGLDIIKHESGLYTAHM